MEKNTDMEHKVLLDLSYNNENYLFSLDMKCSNFIHDFTLLLLTCLPSGESRSAFWVVTICIPDIIMNITVFNIATLVRWEGLRFNCELVYLYIHDI